MPQAIRPRLVFRSQLNEPIIRGNRRSALTEEQRRKLPWTPPMFRPLERNMLDLDPPDHTRLRSLVHKAFTPILVEQIRSHTQSVAGELLDRAVSVGEMDLRRDDPGRDRICKPRRNSIRQPKRIADHSRSKQTPFGQGLHFCLGAPLVRRGWKGQIAFTPLLRLLPNLRLKNPSHSLRWRPSIFLRGLAALPVKF